MEKIISVAIRWNNVIASLPAPARHIDVMKYLPFIKDLDDQGFLTDTGRWISRKEAWELATKNEQLIGTGYTPGILFSEDVW